MERNATPSAMLVITSKSEPDMTAEADREAARAIESAPRMPPIMATLLQAIGIFSPTWLKIAKIG